MRFPKKPLEAKAQKKNENKILLSVHTEPFYVQSRAIKKRTLPLDRPSEDIPINQENSPPQNILSSDSKLMDITPLLIYPQKKAAQMLQISESMMCKKWKESTNRKWPFRSIQKYCKLMKQLINENKDNKNQNQIGLIKKKLKQVLDPVSISLPLSKDIPVFPPLNIDDIDSLIINVEDEQDNNPYQKKLKTDFMNLPMMGNNGMPIYNQNFNPLYPYNSPIVVQGNPFPNNPNQYQNNPNQYIQNPNQFQNNPNQYQNNPNQYIQNPNQFQNNPNQFQNNPNQFIQNPNQFMYYNSPNPFIFSPNQSKDKQNINSVDSNQNTQTKNPNN